MIKIKSLHEVEKVRVLNELTGEYEFTGEVRETNRCTYEVCRWHGAITPEKFMNEVRFKRTPTLSELNEILPETYNKFEVLQKKFMQICTIPLRFLSKLLCFHVNSYRNTSNFTVTMTIKSKSLFIAVDTTQYALCLFIFSSSQKIRPYAG